MLMVMALVMAAMSTGGGPWWTSATQVSYLSVPSADPSRLHLAATSYARGRTTTASTRMTPTMANTASAAPTPPPLSPSVASPS
jgi:hypothetical protein